MIWYRLCTVIILINGATKKHEAVGLTTVIILCALCQGIFVILTTYILISKFLSKNYVMSVTKLTFGAFITEVNFHECNSKMCQFRLNSKPTLLALI